MNAKQTNRMRFYTLLILPLFLVAFGWYTVYVQSSSIERASIRTFQWAELEVVQNAARAAEIYIDGELRRRGVEAVPDVEVEVLNYFVKPIRIGTVGDAWIYSPSYVVFDDSEDFPLEYIGKSMAEIFEIQKQNGAWHYEEMVKAVGYGQGGTGWYVWEPGKAKESAPWWEALTRDSGREIAAWTPVVVFPDTPQELTWVIGMSSMLPEIMQTNGAYNQIHNSIIIMTVVTVVVFALLLLLLRAQLQVQALRQQVAELRIEIDEAKKAKQVAEIVETEYFQNLRARAKAMRERKEGVLSNDQY